MVQVSTTGPIDVKSLILRIRAERTCPAANDREQASDATAALFVMPARMSRAYCVTN